MDLHAVGINDSAMYFNYGLICLVILVVCKLTPTILNVAKVKLPLLAMPILKGIGLIASIGLLVCAIMYLIEIMR